MHGYWNQVLERRLTRRRAIAVTGATAASAAFLAACGGDDNKGGSSGGGGEVEGDKSGLLTKLVDETKNAKAGGTYIGVQGNAPSSLDPHIIGAHVTIVGRTHSQLFRIKDGVLKNTDGEFMGDLAQSWELSPDQLTRTVKLEPEAGFAQQAPVNGRKVDAEDIVYSWGRVEKQGTLRGDLSNKV
ncbi:MAG TPA: hypothetical protein VFX19_12640, partial [Dehalococcoidia bacterium]|nr:hypothetical protein [Dehalococcoidia bacterium]